MDDFIARMEIALRAYGFQDSNTIACSNLCRDEVTYILKQKLDAVHLLNLPANRKCTFMLFVALYPVDFLLSYIPALQNITFICLPLTMSTPMYAQRCPLYAS